MSNFMKYGLSPLNKKINFQPKKLLDRYALKGYKYLNLYDDFLGKFKNSLLKKDQIQINQKLYFL